MNTKYLITAETIFCDYEKDPQVRERYFDRWMESLDSVSKVNVPSDTSFFHFLYVSSDKTDEISRINSFFETLEPAIRSRFKLVTYSHPAEGYGFDAASHPDMLKNPNKIAPRRDALFSKALASHETPTHDRIIRITLDDDDLWLPWHLEEVVSAADRAYEPGELVGVGLENAVIAYFDELRADVVGLTRAMNGNKFYVSDHTRWESQRNFSPWSIPESFDAPNIDRLARSGVRLKWISDNKPGWVYGRWGSNLSGREKERYYAQRAYSFAFSGIDEIASKTAKTTEAPKYSSSSSPNQTSPAQLTDSLTIHVPGAFYAGEGALFSVFRSPGGRKQVILPIERGQELDLTANGDLDKNVDWIAYLQLRTSSGQRFDVTPRARLSSLNEIKALTTSDLHANVDYFDPKYLEKVAIAFSLSEWVRRDDVYDHLENLFAHPPKMPPAIEEERTLLSYLASKSMCAPRSWSAAALSQLRTLPEKSGLGSQTESVQENSTNSKGSNFSMGIHDEVRQSKFCVGDSVVEYELAPTPGQALLVFLHGRKSDKVKLPYFVGRGVSAKHAVSRLSISDPSLALSAENSIAWYAGNQFQPGLQGQLIELVQEVQKKVAAPRVVFIGGSAGGFASLALAHNFPGSVAVVWNPQTDVFEYYKGFVDKYIQTCWGGSADLFRKNAIYSVCELYRKPTGATVLYMQEPTDEFHVEKHMKPFLNNCAQRENTLFYTSHWGEGHVPPPKHLLHQVIDAAVGPNPVSAARDLGFRNAE